MAQLIRSHARAIFACDFLVQHTALFSVVYVFVVMELGDRRIALVSEPQLFCRVAKVLLLENAVRLWLTGDHASDSAATLWLDGAGRRLPGVMLEASRLDETMMPSLVKGTQATRHLLRVIATRWGMRRTVVVAGVEVSRSALEHLGPLRLRSGRSRAVFSGQFLPDTHRWLSTYSVYSRSSCCVAHQALMMRITSSVRSVQTTSTRALLCRLQAAWAEPLDVTNYENVKFSPEPTEFRRIFTYS